MTPDHIPPVSDETLAELLEGLASNSLRSIVRELQERRAAEKKEWRIVSYKALCRHEDRWYSHFAILDDDFQKSLNASITENPEDYRNIRKQYRIAAGPWIDAEPARAEKEGKNGC